MQREFGRSDRLADALQRELARLIRDEVRDPRVGMANINAVEVSPDLTGARVYLTFVDCGDDAGQVAVKTLNKAEGFLRLQLARALQTRTTPRLRFYYDTSGRKGQHLSALIDYAVSRDGRDAPDRGQPEGYHPKSYHPKSNEES